MTPGALQIVKPGLLTSVQDLGRYGHQASGVPAAGPMDTFSHRLANQLAGNDIDAATLEITLIGPEIIGKCSSSTWLTSRSILKVIAVNSGSGGLHRAHDRDSMA